MDDQIPNDLVPDTSAPSQSIPNDLVPDTSAPNDLIPEDEYNQEHYGTPGQQAIAGLEGVGEGLIGPLAPMAEKALGVNPEDINARREANPWTHGIGETAGLVLPALASAGASVAARGAEGAAIASGEVASAPKIIANIAKYGTLGGWMDQAGEGAAALTGLAGDATKMGYAARVGSSAVKNAAEMAAYQLSDDTSKMVTNDKDAPLSAESALAHLGLSAAIGGVAGGLLTGAVSPLWNATFKDKTDNVLRGLIYHFNTNSAAAKNALDGKLGSDGLPRNFTNISAQTGDVVNPEAHEQLRQDLLQAGFKFHDAQGKYTYMEGHPMAGQQGIEPSFIVEHDGDADSIAKLDDLARKYNQQSILSSTQVPGNRFNTLRNLQTGEVMQGFGFNPNPDPTADQTVVPGIGKYALDFKPTEGNLAIEDGQPILINNPVTKAISGIGSRVVDPNFGGVLGGKTLHKGVKAAVREGYDQAAQTAYSSLEDNDSPINQALGALEMKVKIPAWQKAFLSGEPKAVRYVNDLMEVQHPEVMAQMKELPAVIQRSVADKMGLNLDNVYYSQGEEGTELKNTAMNLFKQKYGPAIDALEKRDADGMAFKTSEDDRFIAANELTEKALQDRRIGSDSPYFKLYDDYARRMLAKDDIAGLDGLRTELYNRAMGTRDMNERYALMNIRNHIDDFTERQINDQTYAIGKNGIRTAAEALEKRAQANQLYSQVSKVKRQFSDMFGIRNTSGPGSFMKAINDISPEDFLKKLSPKGNSEAIPFLQQNFPELLGKVREVEARKFISPLVKENNGELTLDVNGLHRKMQGLFQQGMPEYANFILPQEHQQAIRAAKVLNDNMKLIKSSGTAGWVSRLMQHPMRTALSAIAMMGGHNPVSSWLLSELATRLGKNVPEAIKLSFLKSMTHDKTPNGVAFKAMTDFNELAIKGHKKLLNAVENIFEPGARVMLSSQIPTPEMRTKLDTAVGMAQTHPEQLTKYANGNLGYYMPNHQAALSAATTGQLTYLASLKPHSMPQGPLDKPLPPTDMQVARYNRALDIANNPVVVLDKIKNGTIQASDVQDIQAMYPAWYKESVQKLTNKIMEAHSEGKTFPYKTKMALSIYMGQALDQTMQPQNIQMAQAAFIKPQAPQQAPAKTKKGTSTLGKSNKGYMTAGQAAEADRGGRGE